MSNKQEIELRKQIEEMKRTIEIMESLLESEKEEKYLTASELASIFSTSRGCVAHWVQKGLIITKDRKKCHKCLIAESEIERFLERQTKYKNIWLNYNNKK